MAASKNTQREAREARERLRRYNARQSVHEHQLRRRKRDNLFAMGVLVVIAALAAVTQIFYFNGGPGTPVASPSASASAAAGQNVGDVPSPSLAKDKVWTGTLTLNDVALEISLDGAAAPQAVSSFLDSAARDYYNGKTCHRLVATPTAGLIQCGSVDGTGATDPTYSFGPIENPGAGGVYPTGTIAIARAGNNAYSQGRQFFIVVDNATLPDDSAGGYTIIGKVTSGLGKLKTDITNAGTSNGSTDGPPLVPTTITSLTIN